MICNRSISTGQRNAFSRVVMSQLGLLLGLLLLLQHDAWGQHKRTVTTTAPPPPYPPDTTNIDTTTNFTSEQSLNILRRWHYVTSSADHAKYYIADTKRIKGGIVRTWVKQINSPYELQARIADNRDYSLALQTKELVTLEEYDCSEGKSRVISITDYKSNGEISTSNVRGEWTYHIPETVGEVIADYLCEHTPPR